MSLWQEVSNVPKDWFFCWNSCSRCSELSFLQSLGGSITKCHAGYVDIIIINIINNLLSFSCIKQCIEKLTRPVWGVTRINSSCHHINILQDINKSLRNLKTKKGKMCNVIPGEKQRLTHLHLFPWLKVHCS